MELEDHGEDGEPYGIPSLPPIPRWGRIGHLHSRNRGLPGLWYAQVGAGAGWGGKRGQDGGASA